MLSPFLIVLLLSIVAALIIALPIVIFVVGHRKNWKWMYRSLSLIPLLAVVLFLYFEFRTPESFYRDEYKAITSSEFPERAEIQYSTVSSVAFNGDYTSAFMVEMEIDDIRTLKKNLTQRGFNKGFGNFNEQLDYIESKFGWRTYADQYKFDGRETHLVGFLDDHESVVLVRIVF